MFVRGSTCVENKGKRMELRLEMLFVEYDDATGTQMHDRMNEMLSCEMCIENEKCSERNKERKKNVMLITYLTDDHIPI